MAITKRLVCVCMHTYMHACIHACVRAYMHACMHTCVHRQVLSCYTFQYHKNRQNSVTHQCGLAWAHHGGSRPGTSCTECVRARE